MIPEKLPQKVIINVGVSGAGKSSWTKGYIKGTNPRAVRINRDDLRRCLKTDIVNYYNSKWLNPTEDMINHIEEYMLIQGLLKGFTVIIDNTNLKISYINKWVDMINDWNQDTPEDQKVEIVFKIFEDKDPLELKRRVMKRDDLKEYEVEYIIKQIQSLPVVIDYIKKTFKASQIYYGS